MLHWIHVSNNNLCLLLLRTLLIKFNTHSYGFLVMSQPCVILSMCVDSYHSNFNSMPSYEVQKLGK